MPFVVPDICRFAVNQSFQGREVVNVLDYQIDTTGSTMSRNDAIENQAEDIITQWAGQLLPLVGDDLVLESVSYVDLNTADGVTGIRVSSDTVTLPEPGLVTSPLIPGNTSVLVTKQVSSARGRRNGRLFWCGISEGATAEGNGNTVSTTSLAAFQSAWDTFLANTNNVDSVGTAFESNMAVVHVLTRGASPRPGVPGPPLTGAYNLVQNLVVQGLLATQRRRLRG